MSHRSKNDAVETIAVNPLGTATTVRNIVLVAAGVPAGHIGENESPEESPPMSIGWPAVTPAATMDTPSPSYFDADSGRADFGQTTD